MHRGLFEPEHDSFRSAFRAFLQREAVPYIDDWEAAGRPGRSFIEAAAEAGYLGFEVPAEHGGLGISDFRYNVVMTEEVVACGDPTDVLMMQNDIVAPYLLHLTTDDQRRRWLPRFTSGEGITALAMTEPGAGSDLAGITTSARRDGDTLVLNGSKTFITSGATCDMVIVLARTGERDGRGMSLVMVEHGTPGFQRGRPLAKVGRKRQDTAELFFNDCRVPADNILGVPGRGLANAFANLPRERLSIAISALASARAAQGLAVTHVRDRHAFGGPLASLQSVRMTIADMHMEIEVMQAYLDACSSALVSGELDSEEAASAKVLATELQWRVVDQTVQLFGGYGYMEEYPIARMWRDARIQRIYGGANEVLRDLVGRAVCQ